VNDVARSTEIRNKCEFDLGKEIVEIRFSLKSTENWRTFGDMLRFGANVMRLRDTWLTRGDHFPGGLDSGPMFNCFNVSCFVFRVRLFCKCSQKGIVRKQVHCAIIKLTFAHEFNIFVSLLIRVESMHTNRAA
jgi:hypothetical protein